MKLLDLNKCSEASPKFKRHLEAFEVREDASKRMKLIWCQLSLRSPGSNRAVREDS